MAPLLFAKLLVLLSAIVIRVLSLPLEPLPGKSGEDQVREAVRKAEEAAKKAADEAAKHGDNAAELRVAAIKAKLAAQHAIKQRLHTVHKLNPNLKSIRKWGRLSTAKQFASHNHFDRISPLAHPRLRRPLHRNAFSNMISLKDLASNDVPQNSYQEDTTLEDRLALEAEEDKKIGSQYGSDNGDYTFSRSGLSARDASQSIQNQVARESARELKEIQQQINAESQNSLGKTTMGNAAAMFRSNPAPQSTGTQQKPQARNGMMGLQADMNHAFGNADSMNSDSGLASSPFNNAENSAIGEPSFPGLGEQTQPDEIETSLAGMENPGQTEQLGDGQASMEAPQTGDSIQSASSALAAGAGQAAFGSPSLGGISNDVGGHGGPAGAAGLGGAGDLQGDGGLGEGAGVGGPKGFGGAEGLGTEALQGAGSLGGEINLGGAGGGMMLGGGNGFGGQSMKKKSKINKSRNA